jgi:hypothetical protein
MKNYLIMVMCVGLLGFAASGCILFPNDPYPTKYFNLENPKPNCPDGIDLNVQLFRMESATKYKMLYRKGNCHIAVDNYNKWILTPGFMLTRYVQLAFSDSGAPPAANSILMVLEGSITTFEINLNEKQVLLGVYYSLRRYNSKEILLTKSRVFTEKFTKLTAGDFALAMSKAAGKYCEQLRKEIMVLRDQELAADRERAKSKQQRKLREAKNRKQELAERKTRKSRSLVREKSEYEAELSRAKVKKARYERELKEEEARKRKSEIKLEAIKLLLNTSAKDIQSNPKARKAVKDAINELESGKKSD